MHFIRQRCSWVTVLMLGWGQGRRRWGSILLLFFKEQLVSVLTGRAEVLKPDRCRGPGACPAWLGHQLRATGVGRRACTVAVFSCVSRWTLRSFYSTLWLIHRERKVFLSMCITYLGDVQSETET